jgi:uncharacterized membrane protein YciS (DUF1049 family)
MINPNWYPGHKQLRQFAVMCLPGFAAIGFMVHRFRGLTFNTLLDDSAFCSLAIIGAVLCVVGLALPGLIRPVYALLMAVTLPIGWLISSLFLRVIFYGFFTPLGFVFKLLGRDPLQLRKPQSDTFWVKHRQRTDSMSYFRQA